MSRVRLPRIPEADPRILTVDDVNRLAASCDLGDRVLVLLLAYGGLRIGEALPLPGATSTPPKAG